MYAVKNSSRALFVALIPLALVEAVLLAMALLGTQATPQTDMPAPVRRALDVAATCHLQPYGV
jgi:hypothetical protein